MKSMIANLCVKMMNRMRSYKYNNHLATLIRDGLVLGKNVTIAPTANIDYSYPYLINIGDNSTISGYVRLLAHDASPFKSLGYTRLGKVDIKENCYIAERCMILPGVTIGPNALVAAGSVVNKDVPPNSCVAGVPARFYAKFDGFIEKHKEQIRERSIFEYADLESMNEHLKGEVIESVQDGYSYVKGYVGKFPYTLNEESDSS